MIIENIQTALDLLRDLHDDEDKLEDLYEASTCHGPAHLKGNIANTVRALMKLRDIQELINKSETDKTKET